MIGLPTGPPAGGLPPAAASPLADYSIVAVLLRPLREAARQLGGVKPEVGGGWRLQEAEEEEQPAGLLGASSVFGYVKK